MRFVAFYQHSRQTMGFPDCQEVVTTNTNKVIAAIPSAAKSRPRAKQKAKQDRLNGCERLNTNAWLNLKQKTAAHNPDQHSHV